MKSISLIAALLLTFSASAQKSTTGPTPPDSLRRPTVQNLQSLQPERFTIESRAESYKRAPNKPVQAHIITLEGKPYYAGSTAERAELHFYSDSRAEGKPFYDSVRKRIYAAYPIALFEHYLALLRRDPDDVLILFYDDKRGDRTEVTVRSTGKLPLRP